ncbi:hypothetical protein K431DRAFT_342175 [Polychaeton citri CBS 116435]|uniref:HNH nuclease domain-containing protein n=1 Tax=Polychaeton citri CBS 116435 TaxID=1314669 RepID=A0A9P4Q099_9PEZI|nr:hypothetical protein K431DRAFT_342175 [Polychaeton citri CBS 116435]
MSELSDVTSGVQNPNTDGAQRDHAYYDTIWVACSIFISNRQDHWLSTSPRGESRVSADANGLLHAASDDQDMSRMFPIVPNFRAWRYPHGTSQSDENRAQHMVFSTQSIASESCRITSRNLEADSAHIIPNSEKLWFMDNEMDKYVNLQSRTGEVIKDSCDNRLRLRCDAHRLWDKLYFSIVPRDDHTTDNGTAWFTQALLDGEELHEHWHCKKLVSLAGRSPHYLLARFAWDIFPKLHTFLQGGRKRLLTVCTSDDEVETRLYDGIECRQFTRARGETSNNLNESEESQHKQGSQMCDSDGGCSALAGMRGAHDEKAEAKLEWQRYICGHDISDERRGRKRFKT